MVSVVIPVYNVEKYLEKCIEAVVKQTYQDLEIILVDDGSTDESGKICDAYARQDERILVIHQENQGLSAARNSGIDIARGDYITFVDSDDFISVRFVERLVGALEETQSQIAICRHSVYDDVRTLEKACPVSQPETLSREDLYNIALVGVPFFVSAWAKLYDIRLFETLRYPVGELYEDLGLVYDLFSLIDRGCFIDEPLYYYFQRPDSILNSSFNRKKLSYRRFAQRGLNYIEEHYPECQKAAEAKVLAAAIDTMIMIGNSTEEDLCRIRRECHMEICHYRKDWLLDRRLRKMYRLVMFFSYFHLDQWYAKHNFLHLK